MQRQRPLYRVHFVLTNTWQSSVQLFPSYGEALIYAYALPEDSEWMIAEVRPVTQPSVPMVWVEEKGEE